MTSLAHEYTVTHGEIVFAEVVPVRETGFEVAGPDVLPVPWRRVGVGATLGVLAGVTIGLLHSGIGAGAVFGTEVIIAGVGLGIMGSFFACLSSAARR